VNELKGPLSTAFSELRRRIEGPLADARGWLGAGRIALVIFGVESGYLILLHGFMKKVP